jgi:hypothetical protein
MNMRLFFIILISFSLLIGCSKPESGQVIAKHEDKEWYFQMNPEKNPADIVRIPPVYWLVLEGGKKITVTEAEFRAIQVGDNWVKKK